MKLEIWLNITAIFGPDVCIFLLYVRVLGLFGTAMGSGLGGNMLMELLELLFASCPITLRVKRSIGEECLSFS